MKKFKNILSRLFNSGYTEPIYETLKSDILLQNHRNVLITSFIGSIIMSLLTITALFVSSVSKVLPLYLTTAVIFIGIYLISRLAGSKSSTLTLICNYAFLSTAFFFALGLDIIQKNPTATTVCVLLVALPLLIVDKPLHEFLFFLIVSICFMLESVYIKQSPKASIDVLNSISFLLIGTFLGYKHNQMVLRNMNGHRMLEHERDTDTLTDLYNKSAIENRVVRFMEQDGATGSLIVIDMDNFKFINDTYGHHSGDEILAAVGKLLSSLFHRDGLISRFGGDEFVVFLPSIDDMEQLKEMVEQIIGGIRKIRITANADYRAHVCIGIAIFPKDGGNYEELFRSADSAMYKVKKNGKNGYGFYGIKPRKKVLITDDIEMNRAILRKTLCAEYDIFEAEDGHAALAVLADHPDIDMVITDIQMPNMDGIELIRQIRTNTQLNDLSIIANTQYGDMKQEENLFKLGIDDFIYKAASPDFIQMRVKNVLKIKDEL